MHSGQSLRSCSHSWSPPRSSARPILSRRKPISKGNCLGYRGAADNRAADNNSCPDRRKGRVRGQGTRLDTHRVAQESSRLCKSWETSLYRFAERLPDGLQSSAEDAINHSRTSSCYHQKSVRLSARRAASRTPISIFCLSSRLRSAASGQPRNRFRVFWSACSCLLSPPAS